MNNAMSDFEKTKRSVDKVNDLYESCQDTVLNSMGIAIGHIKMVDFIESLNETQIAMLDSFCRSFFSAGYYVSNMRGLKRPDPLRKPRK